MGRDLDMSPEEREPTSVYFTTRKECRGRDKSLRVRVLIESPMEVWNRHTVGGGGEVSMVGAKWVEMLHPS